MSQNNSLQSPQPVIVIDLVPEVLDELIKLLSSLAPADWQRPTVCAGWTVKDVALHLLGVEIGNLSSRRDNHFTGREISEWDELVAYLNEWNENWVHVARRISAPLLIDMLATVGKQMNAYFRQMDPYQLGGPVSWAGPQPAPVWLDLAREYTERWHHQQHIRDAVGRPGLKDPRYLAPILATFVYGLPRAFQSIASPEGTVITLNITGPSGGAWSILRSRDEWKLYIGTTDAPQATVTLDEDLAWRLFTRGLTPAQIRHHILLEGNPALASQVLEVVSIIA